MLHIRQYGPDLLASAHAPQNRAEVSARGFPAMREPDGGVRTLLV